MVWTACESSVLIAGMATTKHKKGPRFGVGEWYSKLATGLSAERRLRLSEEATTHRSNGSTTLARPFKGGSCTKQGGVCSMRLYDDAGGGLASPSQGKQGRLRTLCPNRFQEASEAYKVIGREMLGTDDPYVVSEVGFLRKEGRSSDVGKIDNVLVDRRNLSNWCALEIQAVYFSGPKMETYLHQLGRVEAGIPFPDVTRRPDYRSSSSKRLMPQLQVKVPTLRRWAKKMAILVDRDFFESIGRIDEASGPSNADIAWFAADFQLDGDRAKLTLSKPVFQTLEKSVENLTGGIPVSLEEFEAMLADKVAT